MRVLIADDDKQLLAFLKGCLTAWGYSVTTARDGAAALGAIHSDPNITVAIMNWMMPGMDGWRVSRLLKGGRAREVHTIVVVGAPFRNAAKEAFGSWADDYIGKPFDLQDLRARLEAAIQTLRAKEEAALAALACAVECPVATEAGLLLHSKPHPNWN